MGDEYLCVGAVCYDSRPDELTVMGLEQDFSTRDANLFGGRSKYAFATKLFAF